MKPRKKTPAFSDDDAERAFWATHDSSEYVDWSRARTISAPNLRPSLRTLSLCLPRVDDRRAEGARGSHQTRTRCPDAPSSHEATALESRRMKKLFTLLAFLIASAFTIVFLFLTATMTIDCIEHHRLDGNDIFYLVLVTVGTIVTAKGAAQTWVKLVRSR